MEGFSHSENKLSLCTASFFFMEQKAAGVQLLSGPVAFAAPTSLDSPALCDTYCTTPPLTRRPEQSVHGVYIFMTD